MTRKPREILAERVFDACAALVRADEDTRIAEKIDALLSVARALDAAAAAAREEARLIIRTIPEE